VRDEQRLVSYHPTPQGIQRTLDSRPHIVVEHFQGLVVQQWHDFLADLYRAAVRAGLDTPGSRVGGVAIKLDLDALHTAGLPDAVADAARDRFDREESEKLPRVAKILGRTDVINVEALAGSKATIKANVLARNVLQHNAGIVRPYDLDANGGPFDCDTGERIVKVGLGEQLQRTVYDLATCVDAMTKVAHALVP
jgi:hypothetical protein